MVTELLPLLSCYYDFEFYFSYRFRFNIHLFKYGAQICFIIADVSIEQEVIRTKVHCSISHLIKFIIIKTSLVQQTTLRIRCSSRKIFSHLEPQGIWIPSAWIWSHNLSKVAIKKKKSQVPKALFSFFLVKYFYFVPGDLSRRSMGFITCSFPVSNSLFSRALRRLY